MTRALSTLLVLMALNCMGQTWVEYRVDSNLTLRLPDHPTVMDTLGYHMVRAQLDNALIMVHRVAHNDEIDDIKNKDELIRGYNGFRDGVIQGQKGSLIGEQSLVKDGLQVVQFSYRAHMGNETHIRHAMGVFLNENWYLIQFWEAEGMTAQLKGTRDEFFSSVKFPAGVTLDNQLTHSEEQPISERIAFYLGYYGVLALAVGALIAFIIAISRRYR